MFSGAVISGGHISVAINTLNQSPTLSAREENPSKTYNIGPQCVQNRRIVGSSRKESKRAVRDHSFNNIQASVTASCGKSV